MKKPLGIGFLFLGVILPLSVILFSCEEEKEVKKEVRTYLVYPDGGETFINGGTMFINWIDDVSVKLRIRLYKGGVRYCSITDSCDNTGSYTWEIPAEIESGTDYTIKIFSNNNDFISYENVSPFRIIGKGVVTLFTDPRDNKVYETIQIGNQVWMAENFDYETPSGSWKYPLSSDKDGRHYDLSTAINSCPYGWRLPSDNDWKVLETYIGISSSELNKDGERGKYEAYLLFEGGLGFNIKYTGYYNSFVNSFNSYGFDAIFWSSTPYSGSSYWARKFSLNTGTITRTKILNSQGYSVRYIKI